MCFDPRLDHYPAYLILCEEMNGKDFTETKLLQFINTVKRHQSKKIWFRNTWCNWRKQQSTVTDDTYLPNNAASPFQLFNRKRGRFISP